MGVLSPDIVQGSRIVLQSPAITKKKLMASYHASAIECLMAMILMSDIPK
jgi:hypothetical protein